MDSIQKNIEKDVIRIMQKIYLQEDASGGWKNIFPVYRESAIRSAAMPTEPWKIQRTRRSAQTPLVLLKLVCILYNPEHCCTSHTGQTVFLKLLTLSA